MCLRHLNYGQNIFHKSLPGMKYTKANIHANKSLLIMSLNILLLEKVVTAKCTYPCKGLYNCPGRYIPLRCNTYKNKNQISNLRIHEEE